MLCMHKTKGEKIVEAFWKEYLNNSVYKVMMWLLCGIALLLGSVCITIPCSLMLEDIKTGDRLMFFLLVVCVTLATFVYLRPYEIYNEDQKFYPIEEFFKYIPICHRDFCMVKTRKVVEFQTCVFLVFTVLQTIVSVIAKTFSIWCIVYVFVMTFVIPIFIISIFIWGVSLLQNKM